MAAAKQTLRKSNDNTSLAQSLNGVKPFTVLTVIRTHASSYAFVELADNGQHLLWYSEACEHHPQQLSVDGVICFLEIAEAHAQGDSPSSSEFLQSSHDEQHVHC